MADHLEAGMSCLDHELMASSTLRYFYLEKRHKALFVHTCRTVGLGSSSEGFSDEVGSSQGPQSHSNSSESLKYVSYGEYSVSLKAFYKANRKGVWGERFMSLY